MSKYDLEAIRKAIKPTWAMPAAGCYYDEEEDPDGTWCLHHFRELHAHWWIQAAKSLHAALDRKYKASGLVEHTVGDERSRWVRYGDTNDLRADDAYSWGSLDIPEPVEGYIQLWHSQNKWPFWVYFAPEGIDVCETSCERKGMIFAAKPFLKWGWEDPGIWQGLSRWLAAEGFEVEWSPEG